MLIAANYSRPLANLIARGRVAVDRLKCPAWPWLIDEARRAGQPYVHFPLEVGWGCGDATDTEKGDPPDWALVERLLHETGSAHVNLHLGAPAEKYPDVTAASVAVDVVERVVERAGADVAAVVRRFGAERVALENGLDDYGERLLAAVLPAVCHRVADEAGCGLVLDLAHARIASRMVGLSEAEYLRALPLERLREVHVTGVQPLDRAWRERLAAKGADLSRLRSYFDRDIDHMPMTEGDRQYIGWSLPWLLARAPEPWVVSLELGGVGPLWESWAIPEALETEIALLRRLLHCS